MSNPLQGTYQTVSTEDYAAVTFIATETSGVNTSV